jgi:hypothetical protein
MKEHPRARYWRYVKQTAPAIFGGAVVLAIFLVGLSLTPRKQGGSNIWKSLTTGATALGVLFAFVVLVLILVLILQFFGDIGRRRLEVRVQAQVLRLRRTKVSMKEMANHYQQMTHEELVDYLVADLEDRYETNREIITQHEQEKRSASWIGFWQGVMVAVPVTFILTRMFS